MIGNPEELYPQTNYRYDFMVVERNLNCFPLFDRSRPELVYIGEPIEFVDIPFALALRDNPVDKPPYQYHYWISLFRKVGDRYRVHQRMLDVHEMAEGGLAYDIGYFDNFDLPCLTLE